MRGVYSRICSYTAGLSKKGNNLLQRYGYFRAPVETPQFPPEAPSSRPPQSLPRPGHSSLSPSIVHHRMEPTLFADPSKKRRKGATRLSCAECRRSVLQSLLVAQNSHLHRLSCSLKLRCDRNVPCGSCVKRGCGAICPDGTSSSPSFLSFLDVIASAL